MEVIKNLELKLLKYLCLRKIFYMFEFFCLVVLFFVFLFSSGNKVAEIPYCMIAVVIVPESFLLIHRWKIRSSIKNRNLLANANLGFYTEMKADFEKLRNDLITQDSKKNISDECEQLVWKEEMCTGWLSTKIKECEKKCNEAKQVMESLESIKKGLVIF